MNDHGSDDDFQEDSFCTAPKTKKPRLCTLEEAIFENNNYHRLLFHPLHDID